MKEDKQMLIITHISQLLVITGFGGFIVPLILWLTQRERVAGMDAHGKMIMNFQISLFIYSIVCIPLVFLFGLGIFLLIIIAVFSVVFPIVNAIKTSNEEIPHYPFTIEILK